MRAGLSQKELAAASGISLSLVKKLEEDQRDDVRVETALKLAKALGVKTAKLLRREDDSEASQDTSSLAWRPVRRALVRQASQLDDEEVTAEGITSAMRDLAPSLTSHDYAVARDLLPALIRDADALDDEEHSRRIHADLLTTTGYLLAQTRQFDAAESTLVRAIDLAADRLDAAAPADTLVWLYLRQGKLA